MPKRLSRLRRAAIAVVLTSILTALAAAGAASAPAASNEEASEGTAPRPNVVIILTDDQRVNTMRYMPLTRKRLVRPGISFENAFVPNPICCPSRASILTGTYSHTNGVWTNGDGGEDPPTGGFLAFDDSTTLATELDGA